MKFGVGQGALAIAAFGLIAGSTVSPAAADTASEIRALKARLLQLETQVAKQRAEVKHATNVANAAHAHKDDKGHKPPPPVFVSFKNGLFVETEDKDFSFHIGGRVHVDGGFQGDPRTGDASNVLLRRARLDVAGKAFKYWYYRTQFEFGSSNANVRDAWLAFKYPIFSKLGSEGMPDIVIQAGNQLRPLGLEAMSTSNSGITFIERTMMSDAFNTPRRHLGLSASTGAHNWGVKAGIYGGSPQDAALRPNRDGLGNYWEVAGRGVFLPIRTEEDLVHFGVSGRYRDPQGSSAASDDELLFGRGPRNEANALNTRLMGTPDLSCTPGAIAIAPGYQFFGQRNIPSTSCLKRQYGFNLEAVAIHGPFSLQAEYARTYYSFDPSTSAALLQSSAFAGQPSLQARLAAGQGLASSAAFDGWYVQGAVFLTGETRITGYTDIDHNVNTPYTFSTQPKILNPISKGGYGAFEVAARYSSLNANSGSQGMWSYLPMFVGGNAALIPQTLWANTAGITGGRVGKITVGLNWYPEKGYRVLFNYGRVIDNVAPYNQPFLANAATSTFLTRAEVWW